MPNVTNKLMEELNMNDGEEWVDVECDGCGAMLGACPESEWPEKELVLCSHCDYTCCSYTRLEQVDPVKYADEIAKQKKACSSVPDVCWTTFTPVNELEAMATTPEEKAMVATYKQQLELAFKL